MAARNYDSRNTAAAAAEMQALLEGKLDEMPEICRVIFTPTYISGRHGPPPTFHTKGLLRASLAPDVDLA